jgi:fused signal recognition particle receptor
MFDFLKKKIGGFVDKLTKKEESKEPPSEPKKPPKKTEEPKALRKPPEKTIPKVKKAEPKPQPKKEKVTLKKTAEKKPAAKEKKPEPKKEARAEKPKAAEKPAAVEKPVIEKPEQVPEVEPGQMEEPVPEPEEIIEAPQETVEVEEEQIPEHAPQEPAPGSEPEVPEEEEFEPQEEPEAIGQETEIDEPEIKMEKPEPAEAMEAPGPEAEVQEKPEQKPKERIKLGAFGAIKSFITKQVEISDEDVGDLLEEFELELLEADVDMGVAESIKDELREKLIGAKVKKDELHEYINRTMRETLIDMLYNENAFDMLTKVRESEKPVKIMFLGINGAGKTTTIAKVAKLLLDNNQKVVFAAADTFRAAAIEQMQVHAERLNVKVIKRDYGSDPTSVAYDAMNYAKAHGIDAVLIDTAGRQDTNISLINEMKKMTRVIAPEMKVYIGESIAGNAIIEQISSFNREIGLDAVILTKLDCDPKGGTMLSINKVTGVPIIYVGMGQGYEDLEPFDAETIVSRIVE